MKDRSCVSKIILFIILIPRKWILDLILMNFICRERKKK